MSDTREKIEQLATQIRAAEDASFTQKPAAAMRAIKTAVVVISELNQRLERLEERSYGA